MNIIKITGGLGNQMFQYALYVSMHEKGIEVKMDATNLEKYLNKLNRNSIFNCFNVLPDFANISDIKNLGDEGTDILSKIKRKLKIYKKSHYVQKYSRAYYPEIFSFTNMYLDGYWINTKYFEKYLSRLVADFTLKNSLSKKNNEMLDLIRSTKNSVSIHIRLGDFMNKENINNLSGIATIDYYKKAISIIEDRFDNKCIFFVFSNEPDKAKEMFKNQKFIYVEGNSEFDGHIDMILMSACKHNILANSTFSFWAALLNSNKDKIVIAPKKWSNSINENDNCPIDWTRL